MHSFQRFDQDDLLVDHGFFQQRDLFFFTSGAVDKLTAIFIPCCKPDGNGKVLSFMRKEVTGTPHDVARSSFSYTVFVSPSCW